MKFKVVFISFLLTTFLFHLSESKGHVSQAGSLAAGAMAAQGGTVAGGGIFATLQSVGAAGLGLGGKLGLGSISGNVQEKSSECKCPRRTPTYCETAVMYGTGAVTAVGTVAATPVVLGAAGFTAAGVQAGSLAAGAMAAQGGAVASGSIFATLQSVGAAGLGLGGKLGLGSISAAVGTGIGSFAARVCGEEVECGPCEEENTKG